jgi:predicted metal-dependent hydrolase
MQHLKELSPIPDLSGAWCNSDMLVSSVMEAVSFVTPTLEKFFIRTVAEVLAGGGASPEVCRQAREFIREESSHSVAHQRFNAALLDYLDTPPPALAMIERLLDATKQRLSLPARLQLVEALEHASEIVSARYLRREAAWAFQCAFARRLFAQHAREEMGHRAVVQDMRPAQADSGRGAAAVVLGLAWLVIALAGAAYLMRAVPWILRRKGRRGRNASRPASIHEEISSTTPPQGRSLKGN